ncbi:Tripartite motif-containing protein 29 [Liparis tanakae]|uniref:Tripartite motif-containing protein 29 n=1 Tax=Liparis tanakae TaxID=230148 RepID=A0A4Z2ERR7_9TELE|nr:Tripartite motif-containing protein 29 [Liparis tanakae]
MADTAAGGAAPGSGEASGASSVCGVKGEGPGPAGGPKQNGTGVGTKEEQEPPGGEETRLKEDLKEPEKPTKPGEDGGLENGEEEAKEAVKEAVKEAAKEAVKEAAKEAAKEEAKEAPLGPDDVVCDSCIESPCRALKSCLTCLVSYCEAHLRPHLENAKFQNHRLVAPLRDIERRTCESHRWPLELYCCADGRCVCQDCVAEEHRGHNTLPVAEARGRIEASGRARWPFNTGTRL